MSLLAAKNYDPAVAVSKSCGTVIPMTALDTTNLRVTFTVPASGNVMVRLRGTTYGNAICPSILFGILEGTTIRARVAPTGTGVWYVSSYYGFQVLESTFTVTGLTAGASLTWDAAYGVEYPTGDAIYYGGPDDSTQTTAYGAFIFEVWSA